MERVSLAKYSLEEHEEEFHEAVTTFKQFLDKTMDEYLERFERLWESWPNHGIHKYMLTMGFLNGMIPKEHQLMNVMAGGQAWNAFLRMFGTLFMKGHTSLVFTNQKNHSSAKKRRLKKASCQWKGIHHTPLQTRRNIHGQEEEIEESEQSVEIFDIIEEEEEEMLHEETIEIWKLMLKLLHA